MRKMNSDNAIAVLNPEALGESAARSDRKTQCAE
jgi:hypothetical protein